MPQSTIVGAFGLKLGDKFDVSTASKKVSETKYEFIPETKNDLFTRYYVEVSPNSKMIYIIGAESTVPVEKDSVRMLKKTIGEKYQDFHGTTFYDGLVTSGMRMVSVHTINDDVIGVFYSQMTPKIYLSIKYEDIGDTAWIASREKRENENRRLEESTKNLNLSGI